MIQPLFLLMRWVQTIPIAMLMLVPFEDRELRVKRTAGCLISGAYLLLICVVLAAVSAACSVDGRRNIAARDLSLAAALAVYFFFWASAIRTPAVRKMLVAVIMLHYAALLNALSNLFAAMILGDRYLPEINADAGSLTFDLCLLAATALTYPLVWYFLRRILRESLPVLGDRQTRRGLGYLCVVFVLFSVVTYNPPYEMQPEALIVLSSLAATDMIAYYIFFQEIGAVRQQGETARQLERYQMQYRQISARVDEARRLRHDMRHHLNTLGALNAQGRQAEIADYLKRYGTVYDRLEGLRRCGDPVVDSVLDYYLALAGEEGVPVRCSVLLAGGSGIDPMDMTVLLGNCLENSLEALRKLPREARRLDIDLQPAGAVLLLQVINSCGIPDGPEGFAGWESFASTKRGGGTGLRSIAGIAEKYGGSARFRRAGGTFTVRVVLNLP